MYTDTNGSCYICSRYQDKISGKVNAIAIDPDTENIYVGGDFEIAGSNYLTKIAMWNPKTCTWFPLGGGTAGSVTCLLVINKKVYVAGSFPNVITSFLNSVSFTAGFAIWNIDTSTWSVPGPSNTGFGSSAGVASMVYDPIDNKIYLGGAFSNSTYGSKLLRYNISSNTFEKIITTAPNGDLLSLSLDITNRKLYVGGKFTQINLLTYNRIALYDINLGTFSSLGNGFPVVTNAFPYSMFYDSISSILYVGGFFNLVGNNITANNIAVWNTITSTWSPLLYNNSNGLNNRVNCINIIYDGSVPSVYLGGLFNNDFDNTIFLNKIAIWKPNNSVWINSFNSGANNEVITLIFDSNKQLYIGGNFTMFNGKNIPYLTKVSDTNLSDIPSFTKIYQWTQINNV
jgi:hypothetical protein